MYLNIYPKELFHELGKETYQNLIHKQYRLSINPIYTIASTTCPHIC